MKQGFLFGRRFRDPAQSDLAPIRRGKDDFGSLMWTAKPTKKPRRCSIKKTETLQGCSRLRRQPWLSTSDPLVSRCTSTKHLAVMDVEQNSSVHRLCSPDCVGNSEHCNCVSGGIDVLASGPEDCVTRQERIPETPPAVRIGAASGRKLLRRRDIQ